MQSFGKLIAEVRMKKIIFSLALMSATSTFAGQAWLEAGCVRDASDFGGMHTIITTHAVHLQNDSDTKQIVHVKITGSVNYPAENCLIEYDKELDPGEIYHNNVIPCNFKFHYRPDMLFIITSTTQVSGYINKTESNQCYFRVIAR